MIKERHIDLHTHTTFSDGLLTPRELLMKARTYRLSAIAITDHDTISAYVPETFSLAKKLNVELIPGIEFSTRDAAGTKYHILGLLVDAANPELNMLTDSLRVRREAFMIAQSKKLQTLGYVCDIDSLRDVPGTVTKPHLARKILEDPRNKALLESMFGGIIPDEGRFIEETMIKGKSAYILQPDALRPEEAVKTIHNAGGLAILAHPSSHLMEGQTLAEIADVVQTYGLDGLEAIYVQYDRANQNKEVDYTDVLLQVAHDKNLATSGGSDFHGNGNTTSEQFVDLGFHNQRRKVSYSVLEALRFKKNENLSQ